MSNEELVQLLEDLKLRIFDNYIPEDQELIERINRAILSRTK